MLWRNYDGNAVIVAQTWAGLNQFTKNMGWNIELVDQVEIPSMGLGVEALGGGRVGIFVDLNTR